jgi:hypothetical protein
MNFNAALVLTLMFSASAALFGYWLGRRRQSARVQAVKANGAGVKARATASANKLATPRRAHQTGAAAHPSRPRNSSESLRKQIDDRLDQLRRARENAEPWQPPAVDLMPPAWRLDIPTRPMVFADTTIDPQATH